MNSSVRKTMVAVIGVSGLSFIVYAFCTGGFLEQRYQGDTAWAATVDGGGVQKTSTVVDGEAPKQLIDVQLFLRMLNTGSERFRLGINEIDRKWDVSYVPIMLESMRFLPPGQRAAMIELMQSKTGQKHGGDFNQWYQWLWKQQYEPHPQYGQFKASFYQRLDRRFAEYFQDTDNATIRLDEIRWGGVVRDGIPPLKNPKMLRASDAKYLGEKDVVFGIELNGDARCYPKRILAWHEMFKDTIGGESVCGVY